VVVHGFMTKLLRLARVHIWGLLLLAVAIAGSTIAVRAWTKNHPGAMTVLESQAMDMNAMKPPVGAVPVVTETVQPGPFMSAVTYTGSVAPFQEQDIYPRVEGWITDFRTYNGDRVSQGQLLAVIDSPDLQSRAAAASAGSVAAAADVPGAKSNVERMAAEKSVAQEELQSAKADLARAKAMLASAEQGVVQRQKELKSARANNDYWSAEIAREKRLLKSGAVSQQEYQSERAQATSAEAEVGSKQAMLTAARADVDVAKAEIAGKESGLRAAASMVKAAEAALAASRQEAKKSSAMARQASAEARTAAILAQYRYIRAPFAGKVTLRYQSPGQFVTPSTAILNVVQIDRVRLQANVADKDIARIKVGDPITAHFDKDPGLVVNGRVTSVSPLADELARTAVVEAIVPNPGNKLVPGDAVKLRIGTSRLPDAMSVPLSAIVHRDGGAAVWIVRTEAPKGKRQYYCTMHPEVVSDKPGTCPKCLMALVPKTTGGAKKAHLVMVETGASDGRRVAITKGLCDGDEVIYDGNTYLREGDSVFPTKPGAEAPPPMPAAPAMPGTDHTGHDMHGMPGM